MSLLRLIYTRISQGSAFLPAITGLIYFRKLNAAFRLFACFFWFSLLIEWMSTNSLKLYGNENNMPIGRIFFLVEFLVFSIIYYLFFRHRKAVRLLIGINVVIGIAVALIDAFYINGVWGIPTIARSYSAYSIVAYVLIYFYFLFKDVDQNNRDFAMFWLSSGAFLYFADNSHWFSMYEYFRQHNKKDEMVSWVIHDLFNIVAHCSYAYSFTCFRKQGTI